MDEHVESSCRSWLGNFMQRFSWLPPFAQVLEFLNNYFLLGVCHGLKIQSKYLINHEKVNLSHFGEKLKRCLCGEREMQHLVFPALSPYRSFHFHLFVLIYTVSKMDLM